MIITGINKNHRFKMEDVTLLLIVLYMNFYTLFSNLLHLSNIKIVVPLMFLLSVTSVLFARGYVILHKKTFSLCSFWIIFLFYQSVWLNLGEDNPLMMFRQAMYFIIWFHIAQITKWNRRIMLLISSVCFINTLATFVFFVKPSLYKIMIRIYGRSVSGTSGGRTGYRAALADHYSQNAIFISMAVLAAACILLALLSNRNKYRRPFRIYGCMFFLSVIALFLTSKRGPLLFCGVAIVMIYFLSGKKNVVKKIVIFCLIGIVTVGIFLVLAKYIPELSYTIERFSDSGEDGSSQERKEMWKLAIKMFKEHPIFGNKTYSYRLQYAKTFGSRFMTHGNEAYQKYLNSHDVFLQVLAENGIVGLILFAFAYFQMFFSSIRTYFLVREVESDYKIVAAALFSVAIQIYFLFYCITGNPMYDIFYFYYCCGMGINLSLRVRYEPFFQLNRKILKNPVISLLSSLHYQKG
ncbi:MAG: O-antigen ligase family protein [Oscillospiraceae bacterium]|nr:O-antigen ligase family protein [Oscillospiraceae bacterium]